jgi:hypothetical protein
MPSFTRHGPSQFKEIYSKSVDKQLSPWCQVVAWQCFVTQSGHFTRYLKQEKVIELSRPPFTQELAPCDFFLFPKLGLKNSWFGYFLVSEQNISKRLWNALKQTGLKDLNFDYHMVVSILKNWDNYFGTVC